MSDLSAIYKTQNHLVHELVQHLSVNFNIALRLRTNPTPIPTPTSKTNTKPVGGVGSGDRTAPPHVSAALSKTARAALRPGQP